MKTIIYECDICKDKTEKNQQSRIHITDEFTGEWMLKDACPDCRKRIMNFIEELELEYENEKSD